MNLVDIREGLKDRLTTIVGLRCYDTVPDKPELPAAIVVPGDPYVEYNSAFARGLTDIRLEVRLLVSTASADRIWQGELDCYCSAGAGAPNSILDAIAAERTLGGVVNDAFVTVASKYGKLPQVSAESPVYGTVTLEVLMHTPRT